MGEGPASLLPEIKENKRLIQQKRNRLKKKMEKREKEWTGRPKKGKKETKDTKKVRKAKTVVANAKVGKETLRKKNASALVEENRKKKQLQTRAKLLQEKRKKESTTPSTEEEGSVKLAPPAPRPVSQKKRDRQLLEQTLFGGPEPLLEDPSATFKQDLSVPTGVEDPHYPSMGESNYFSDYAEKKKAELVSEKELLEKAHVYFTDLNKKEKELKKAAVQYIQKMKEVNRRGGDKDGFRYVIPKNTKSVVRRMLASQGGNYVDPDSIVSTFGGDKEAVVEDDKSDLPTRKKRRPADRNKDFYQFQVTREWTKNAERFLKRSKSHKALFEAKKHQRSIRKL